VAAVFGNREQGFVLEVTNATAISASLRADMLQHAGVLMMPVAKDVHVLDGVTLSGATAQRLHVSLKFPEVKQRAEIIVSWSLISGTSPKIPLGNSSFEVFPGSVTAELTDLLKPKLNASGPVVFGPGKKLRQFLSAQHVTFEDGGSDTPDRFDPNRSYFGELDTAEQFQDAQDHSAGARMVLFSSDESLPPGVYSERSSARVLIRVTSPLLDNLATDPRAQLTLTKIIHLLSTPSPAN
jgi:hypothetical protein